MIVTNDFKFSSNINEVIRSVIKFFCFFFYKKISQVQKRTKLLTANKSKKLWIKTSKGKNSLICLFAFYAFAWLCFYAFSAFSAFNAFNAFCMKQETKKYEEF